MGFVVTIMQICILYLDGENSIEIVVFCALVWDILFGCYNSSTAKDLTKICTLYKQTPF